MRDFLHQIGRKMRERALLREENELLSDLSFGLRAKLALSINKHYLHKMPFFAQADEKFVSEVSSRGDEQAARLGGLSCPAARDGARAAARGVATDDDSPPREGR